MKKNGADFASLTPAAGGWSLRCGASPAQNYTTLAEAANALPSSVPVQLALPSQVLVIETLQLPATEHEELAGMVRLQLEKNLPYVIEEVSSDFVTVERGEKESTVISLAAPHAPLEALCQPLRDAGRVPEKITPYVLHVAAACPPGETVLAVYPEQEHTVLAICDDGRLRWAHVIASTDPARVSTELPQAMLAASMEGVPANFSRVLLAAEAPALAPVLRAAFPLPVETLSPAPTALDVAINFVPASWRSDARRQQRTRRLRQQLKFAAVIYLLAAIGTAVYLILLQRQARTLQAQFLAVRPQLEFIQVRQARSQALAPAFDPSRFTVELLYLVQRALPDPAVRITEFDQQPGQWRVTGEAPNAGLAIEYVTRLKADKELSAYQINAGPPQLLPNEHAQFSIFGTR